MVKTVEDYKREAQILKEARAGIKKEKREAVKQKFKKVAQEIRAYRIKKTRKPSLQKRISKAVVPRKQLSSNLMRTFGGVQGRQVSQKRVKEGPGRPRGDYKHKDPQSGQPIPATVYYKRVKELRRQAEQSARLRDIQQVQELGKRGIPPEQAKQIVDTRQLQSVGVQQVQPQRINPNLTPEQQRQLFIQQQMQQSQNQRPMPQQMPSNYPSQAVRPIWRRQPTVDTDWGLFGRKKVVRGIPQSFWN